MKKLYTIVKIKIGRDAYPSLSVSFTVKNNRAAVCGTVARGLIDL